MLSLRKPLHKSPSRYVEICGVQLLFILTSPAMKMYRVMKRHYLLSLLRTIRGYRSKAEQYPAPSCDGGSNLAKRTHVSMETKVLACRVLY
jgi:hypothetical protein